jgi:hypothetical protein
MKRVTSALAALFVACACGAASAQDDYEAVKKRILAKLEAEIKGFYAKLETELRKTLREEIAKLEGKAPGSQPQPQPQPRPQPQPQPQPQPVEKKPGYLGILSSRDFDDAARKERGLEAGHGILVESTRDGSPAEKGGLAGGMVILAINGEKVTEESMREIMRKYFAGDVLKVSVQLPDKSKKVLEVTLGAR